MAGSIVVELKIVICKERDKKMSNLLTDDEDLHIHIHGEKSVRIEFLEEGDFEGSGDIEEDERRIKASTAWLVIGKK